MGRLGRTLANQKTSPLECAHFPRSYPTAHVNETRFEVSNFALLAAFEDQQYIPTIQATITMKSFAVLAVCCAGAQAFAPVPRGSFGAKAAPQRAAASSSTTVMMAKSKALPFLECPAALDGSMVGDFGFDPLGLTENIDLPHGESADVVVFLFFGFVFVLFVFGAFLSFVKHLLDVYCLLYRSYDTTIVLLVLLVPYSLYMYDTGYDSSNLLQAVLCLAVGASSVVVKPECSVLLALCPRFCVALYRRLGSALPALFIG